MTREDILKKYIGVPFLNHGRTPAGLDCYGLIVSIYADMGIKLFDVDEMYDAKNAAIKKNYFMENYYRNWEKVKEPKLLDVIGFNNGSGVGYHAGIYLGDGMFIHTIKAGTVAGHLRAWKDKINGFYRYKVDGRG